MKIAKKYKISKLLAEFYDYKPLFHLALNNMKFFIKNIDLIEKWVKSTIFKDKYMYTNHPYPPLLDPKLIDYYNTSTHILWDINAPFPENYAFIWLYTHGSGATSLRDYFLAKTNLKLINTYLFALGGGCEAKYRYFKILKILLSDPSSMYAIALSDVFYRNKLDMDKFFHLFAKENLSILCQVRDPIELVKHFLARKGRWDKTQLRLVKKEIFSLDDTFEDVFIGIEHSYFNKNIRIINSQFIFVYHYFMPVFSKIARKIFYLDIEDIRGADIDIKLQSMSKDLNFDIICDYNNSECISTNYFHAHCMLWLPLIFQIEGINIVFDFHHRKDYSNHIDLHELLIKRRNNYFGIYIRRDDYAHLRDDTLAKYLIDFILKLDNRISLENENLLSINEVIGHLKNNESDRIYLKLILDQENKHIKKHRPDIVKSWKYYAIFEDMF